MQIKSSIAALVVAAIFIPAVAYAEGPRYTYIGFDYAYADPAGLSSSGGIDLSASYAIYDRLHILAEQLDVSDGPDKYTRSTVVLGWNHPVSSRTDVVTRFGYVRERVTTGLGTFNQDGGMVTLGARSMITPDFEFNGHVIYMNTGTATGGGGFGMRYYGFNDYLSIGASFDFFEDTTLLRGGIRFNF